MGKTGDDLSNATYNIVSALGDSADTMAILEVAAKNATAGVASTEDSVNLLAAVMKGYGDVSLDTAQKVSDLSFLTVKLGQTSIPDLASSMQRVTSISNTMGESQEAMFATFSSLTGVIGNAAEVSTKYAAVQKELLAPTDELKKAFTALGVSSGEELVDAFGSVGGSMVALQGYADSTGKKMTDLFGSFQAASIAMALGAIVPVNLRPTC